jgi:hypothetical protein
VTYHKRLTAGFCRPGRFTGNSSLSSSSEFPAQKIFRAFPPAVPVLYFIQFRPAICINGRQSGTIAVMDEFITGETAMDRQPSAPKRFRVQIGGFFWMDAFVPRFGKIRGICLGPASGIVMDLPVWML